MKKVFFIFCICISVHVVAQQNNYTAANAHSHNDYEQPHPFYEAWQNDFGSIEADIFLHHGKLLVAHEARELMSNRSLDSLYLKPLQAAIEKNKGYPYSDQHKQLQLLIDIKSDSVATINKLIEVLNNYPAILHCHAIKITISGNRPAPENFVTYPSYIYFDGVVSRNYSAKALSKIVMLSDNFRNYSAWNGSDTVNGKDRQRLSDAVQKAHALKKKIRFWNAPDSENSWQVFMRLKVDYINTDHIKELATFLNDPGKK
jgi:alkaline phosphatase